MSNHEDDRTSNATSDSAEGVSRPLVSARLLHKLRRALFEDAAPASAADARESSAVHGLSIVRAPSSELEAAATKALRDVLARELAASAAEFALQVDALAEIIPDLDTRRRAALSVLARKGITKPQLSLELEQALAVLAEQQRSFVEKLKSRRDEHTALATQIEHECSQASASAAREIERLQAALEVARGAQSAAQDEREQRLQTLAAAGERLSDNELAFNDAYQRIHREYQALCQELARISAEKF